MNVYHQVRADDKFSFQPVIILGAGRSGTNLLREALVRYPGVATWPCDEINYLWRTGNTRHPTDELLPQQVGANNRRRIRQAFSWVANRYDAHCVVEKTCANSLRVDFVDRVIPEAKYLLLVRDGIDATASAMKRWGAPIEPRYLAKKARFVPPADLPYYATKYLGSRFHRFLSQERRLGSWGPRFAGMQSLCRTASLAEVCAHQWRACVSASIESLAEIAPDRQKTISYEQFVRQPASTLGEVAAFLDLPEAPSICDEVARTTFTGSLGAGRRALTPEQLQQIEPIVSQVDMSSLRSSLARVA